MAQGHEYPLYSDPQNDRTRVVFLLAIASFLIGAPFVALSKGDPGLIVQGWFLMTATAPLVVFGFLMLWFDRSLWKKQSVRLLMDLFRIPAPPIVGGVYDVDVEWHEPEGSPKDGKSKATVTVTQSWSKISVAFAFHEEDYRKASSASKMASLVTVSDGSVELRYTYRYVGQIPRQDGESHKKARIWGTCTLIMESDDKGGWIISGDYYSDDGGSGKITGKTSGAGESA